MTERRAAKALMLLLGLTTIVLAAANAAELLHEPASSVAEIVLPRIGCAQSFRTGFKDDVFGCDWASGGQIRIHSHAVKDGTSERRSYIGFGWMALPSQWPRTGRTETEGIVRRLLRVLQIKNEDQIVASFFRASGARQTFRQSGLVITTTVVDNVSHDLDIVAGDDIGFATE